MMRSTQRVGGLGDYSQSGQGPASEKPTGAVFPGRRMVFACIAGLMLSTNSMAQSGPGADGSLQLHWGYHGSYQRYQLAYETPALWDYEMGDSSKLQLHVATTAAYWRADAHRSPSSLWQAAILPTLRWWWTPRYYLELGTGPTYISRTRFADKELSTRLQFNSFAGVGMRLGQGHRLGLRYTHISNASIKRPNPGLNLLELSYSYDF